LMNTNKVKLTNKEFSRQLEIRTKRFAIEIIKVLSRLNRTPAGKVISYQILKSATFIGANYREANRSVSKADFRSKISICIKEAAETQYWIELIYEAELLDENKIRTLHKECSELLALFNSIYQQCKEK